MHQKGTVLTFDGLETWAPSNRKNGIFQLFYQSFVLSLRWILPKPRRKLGKPNRITDLFSSVNTSHETIWRHKPKFLFLPNIFIKHISNNKPLNTLHKGMKLFPIHFPLPVRWQNILMDGQWHDITINEKAVCSFWYLHATEFWTI